MHMFLKTSGLLARSLRPQVENLLRSIYRIEKKPSASLRRLLLRNPHFLSGVPAATIAVQNRWGKEFWNYNIAASSGLGRFSEGEENASQTALQRPQAKLRLRLRQVVISASQSAGRPAGIGVGAAVFLCQE